MSAACRLQIEGFFDPGTWTISYIVLDTSTHQCAVVDSVLDYDPKSGRTSHASADQLIARVRELGATAQWILETHVHADHLTAAHDDAAARRADQLVEAAQERRLPRPGQSDGRDERPFRDIEIDAPQSLRPAWVDETEAPYLHERAGHARTVTWPLGLGTRRTPGSRS